MDGLLLLLLSLLLCAELRLMLSHCLSFKFFNVLLNCEAAFFCFGCKLSLHLLDLLWGRLLALRRGTRRSLCAHRCE